MNIVKTLFDLPSELLGKCLSYLSYKQISAARAVCISLDDNCQLILNKGFVKTIKIHRVMSNSIKAQVPRNDWRLPSHHLKRHMEVLMSMEPRINQLKKIYNQYIEWNVCCFIPGKVLDEMIDLLRLVKKSAETGTKLAGHMKISKALYRKSNRAIDHFEKFIVPTFFVNKQDFNVMKKRFKAQQLEIEIAKCQNKNVEADFIDSQGNAQKSIQALEEKVADLESKINGKLNSIVEVKGHKIDIKINTKRRQIDDETETENVPLPKKAKKMLLN